MPKEETSYRFTPIGLIHSPFTKAAGMPIQAVDADGAAGTVEVFEEFAPALADLEGFSHVILLYVFHRSEGYNLRVKPFRDDRERRLFATRAPRRPNPIGLSVVRLLAVEGRVLRVRRITLNQLGSHAERPLGHSSQPV